jgi:hypothetical protein
MERQILRPQPGHSLPIVSLSVLGALAGLALAVGFVAARNPGAAAVMVIAAFVVGGACIAYFRNACVWFDGNQVGKVDLLGRKTTCRLDDLSRVEARNSPQPTLNFMRKDGRRAFRINTRLWTDAQVKAMQGVVRA